LFFLSSFGFLVDMLNKKKKRKVGLF